MSRACASRSLRTAEAASPQIPSSSSTLATALALALVARSKSRSASACPTSAQQFPCITARCSDAHTSSTASDPTDDRSRRAVCDVLPTVSVAVSVFVPAATRGTGTRHVIGEMRSSTSFLATRGVSSANTSTNDTSSTTSTIMPHIAPVRRAMLVSVMH